MFTVEKENQLATEIERKELVLWELLDSIQEVRVLLYLETKRKELYRIGKIHRMEDAIKHLLKQKRLSKANRQKKQQIITLQESIEKLRWDFALSAKKVVYKEAKRMKNASIPKEDLEQEGYIGLLRASRRFELDKKVRFHTYAAWWVRAAITRAIERKGQMIRIPGGALEQRRQLMQLIKAKKINNSDYTNASLAQDMKISTSRVEELLQVNNFIPITMEDENVTEGTGIFLKTSHEPEHLILMNDFINLLNQHLDQSLDVRERFILEHHYGLNGCNKLVLKEIGNRLGISKERVRQLEIRAIRKLKEHYN